VGQVVGGTTAGNAITFSSDPNIGIAVFGTLVVKFEVVVGADKVPRINPYGQMYTTSALIKQFVLDDVLQIAYAPLNSALGFQILRFSLVEISAFHPNYADRRGGALITVTGKGFRNVSSAKCLFDKEAVPVHEYINADVGDFHERNPNHKPLHRAKAVQCDFAKSISKLRPRRRGWKGHYNFWSRVQLQSLCHVRIH
jgi:hypothetical protein